jgi:ankyrin repeat protein
VDAGVVVTANTGNTLNGLQGHWGTPLHAAILRRSFSAIELLLEHGCDVNASGGIYGTALGLAAKSYHNLDIVELLFQYGAEVNVRGVGGTVLQTAADYANAGKVRLLLEHGADVNAAGGKEGSALQRACSRGNLEVVKCLVEHGADVNAEGGKKGSALQRACSRGNLEVVKCLVEHGADVNASGIKDCYGTPLQASRSWTWDDRHTQEMFDYLLEHGARDDDSGI